MLAAFSALAFSQVQEGSYPSLTAEQIAAEFPKIDNEYIVQFKAGSTDEHIQTHLTAVKGMDAEVHKEWHIKTTGEQYSIFFCSFGNSFLLAGLVPFLF